MKWQKMEMERVDISYRDINIKRVKIWWSQYCFRNESQLAYFYISTLAVQLVILWSLWVLKTNLLHYTSQWQLDSWAAFTTYVDNNVMKIPMKVHASHIKQGWEVPAELWTWNTLSIREEAILLKYRTWTD